MTPITRLFRIIARSLEGQAEQLMQRLSMQYQVRTHVE
jgi:hypothetical protein